MASVSPLLCSCSIPVFNRSVQVPGNHLGRLPRMPLHRQHRTVARLDLMPHLARLPVPEADVASAVAAGNELAVRTDRHVARVARRVVAAEPLLPVLSEPVRRRVYRDLVVGALECDVLARRVRRAAHHAVHVWLGDEFDRDRDAVFPGAQGLVIRGCDEAAVLVTERNFIN